MGFAKLYADYEKAGLLRKGQVGRAQSIAIDAAPALALEEDRPAARPARRLLRSSAVYLLPRHLVVQQAGHAALLPRYAFDRAARWLRRAERPEVVESGSS
jgi:hypothetical protein